ncbi:magnesium and cobalt transport protein CorA [Sporichthya sp.]|uniref:magnesium and cobalt transport protein CorA n=1 Tax=Sporichthya sp. TaxID=65475 RepID=UPI001819850D|nr:magnesium and cobalt transport protein CorA [Sporichthya sp.]MBA3743028.1 magnesium and cobalt transport protein CorA [Sporichthya sp.]
MTEVAQRGGRDGVIRCARYVQGKKVDDLPLAGALANCGPGGSDGFVWIECTEPTSADIAAVADEFELPELKAVADAVAEHRRPKVKVHGDVVPVVLSPVHYVDSDEVVEVTELAMFLGPGFVITVAPWGIDALDQVRKEFNEGSGHPEYGVLEVLYRVADRIADGYHVAIEDFWLDVDTVAEQVFDGRDKDRTARIYQLKREVAEFRRAVSASGRTLEQVSEARLRRLSPQAVPDFGGLRDHQRRAADSIESIDRLLSDVLQANAAQIQLRQNEDQRRISAWAAIGLVPTAVAGIYGMNFEHMPELDWQYGYPMVVGGIATICFTLYANFRARDWLGARPGSQTEAARVRRALKIRANRLRRVGRLGSGS